jgi:hypothetical protein
MSNFKKQISHKFLNEINHFNKWKLISKVCKRFLFQFDVLELSTSLIIQHMLTTFCLVIFVIKTCFLPCNSYDIVYGNCRKCGQMIFRTHHKLDVAKNIDLILHHIGWRIQCLMCMKKNSLFFGLFLCKKQM